MNTLMWNADDDPKCRFITRTFGYDILALDDMSNEVIKHMTEGGKTAVTYSDRSKMAVVSTEDIELALAIIRTNPVGMSLLNVDGEYTAQFIILKQHIRLLEDN